jgi:DNA-directed RNA polymerase specialized sigma24 family protein
MQNNCKTSKTCKMKWSLTLERDPDSTDLIAVVTAWEPKKRNAPRLPRGNRIPDLAELYLDRAKNPEAFAEAVFGEIRARARNSRGLLRQRIEEVESLANCLFEPYLGGNPKLRRALTAKRSTAVSQQIERTINAVVSIAKKRTLKALKERLVFMADLPDVLVEHPREISLSDLPVDLKMEMAQKAVEECREEIGHKTADLLSEILERSCPVSEVARELGVSRQAIHMRLAPAIKKVRARMERIDFPHLEQL